MDIRKLQRAIVDGLEDVKGQNIVVFNTEALSPLFERVIIASGTSNRQTKALAASVRDAVKALGEPVPRMEGEDNGEWIIVDCGAAVAHIMQPAIRDYYHLEEIWGVKPVALKAAVRRSGLPKAEEAPVATKAAAKSGVRTVAKAPAPRAGKVATKSTRQPAAAKTVAKTAAKTATKAPARAPRQVAATSATVAAPAVRKTSRSTAGSARTTAAPVKRTRPAKG